MVLMLVAVAHAGGGGPCWVGKAPYPGKDSLEYVSAADAAAQERKRAEVEMREPGPSPPNGLLLLLIERDKLDLADTSTQLVVVESGGKEVLRHEPPADVPEIRHGVYYGWFNYVGVPIGDGWTFPLTVHAADKVLTHRCTWTVAADGDVRRVK